MAVKMPGMTPAWYNLDNRHASEMGVEKPGNTTPSKQFKMANQGGN
jgi:hypothetical protein